MDVLIPKVLGLFLVPPALPLVFLLFGLLLGRRRWLGGLLLVLGTGLLIAFSLPVVGRALLGTVEHAGVVDPATVTPRPQVIVVLGGSLHVNAREYGGEDVLGGAVLERLHYAVRLAKQLRLPVMVSGGAVFGNDTPEARVMAASLQRDFGLVANWVEDRSRTTWENARFSNELLEPQGIRSIFLVTHAWHMPRARYAFETAGLQVTPAPTRFIEQAEGEPTVLEYLPSIDGLVMSHIAAREYLGLRWYQLADLMWHQFR